MLYPCHHEEGTKLGCQPSKLAHSLCPHDVRQHDLCLSLHEQPYEMEQLGSFKRTLQYSLLPQAAPQPVKHSSKRATVGMNSTQPVG